MPDLCSPVFSTLHGSPGISHQQQHPHFQAGHTEVTGVFLDMFLTVVIFHMFQTLLTGVMVNMFQDHCNI